MDSFVKEHFPAIYPTYIYYPANIYRADLFRLLVIYELGGVYADLDIECLKSLDYLFKKYVNDSELVLSYQHPVQSKLLWGVHPVFHFEFAAAIPRSDILHKIIQHIIDKDFDSNRQRNCTYVAGPIAITEALGKLPIKKLVRCRKLTILNNKIVSPLVAIHTPGIPFEIKRASIKMLLKKRFYPETCMVHYYRGTYYAKTKTALTMNAGEFKQLLAEHVNPVHRFSEWLKLVIFLVIFEIRIFLKNKHWRGMIRH
jgi:hypothetical protein